MANLNPEVVAALAAALGGAAADAQEPVGSCTITTLRLERDDSDADAPRRMTGYCPSADADVRIHDQKVVDQVLALGKRGTVATREVTRADGTTGKIVSLPVLGVVIDAEGAVVRTRTTATGKTRRTLELTAVKAVRKSGVTLPEAWQF